MEFQELGEEEEGVFSFFPVYLMAQEGGFLFKDSLSVRDLFGVQWRGPHLVEPPSAGRVSSGAAQAGLGPKVCVSRATWLATHANTVLSRHTSGRVCAAVPLCA